MTREPPWRSAVRITRQRPGLWLVQGEGEFHALRFSVDTTPETTSISDPSSELTRSLKAYANEVWTELPPKLASVRMEDAPGIAADVVAGIAQRILIGQEGVPRWKVLEGVAPLPNLLIQSDPETPVIATSCGNRLIVVSLERGPDGLYRCRRVEGFERNPGATHYGILPEQPSAGQQLVHEFARAVRDRLLSRLDSKHRGRGRRVAPPGRRQGRARAWRALTG